jgi:hypothetical protein
MKKYLILVCTFFLFFIARSQSISPQVIATAGDYFVGTNASLSWTLGEVITETVSNTNYTLTQGFQQPHYNITGIPDDPTVKNEPLGDISIYPNPVGDQLNVSFKDMNQNNVIITLFDLNGKILLNEIAENTTSIKQLNMTYVAKGNYVIRFASKDGKYLKSFKVVKY